MSDTQIKTGIDSQSLKKLLKGFSVYTIVGIVFTGAYVFLMWLFVDIFKLQTFSASCVVVVGLHIAKFIAYRSVRLIERQFKKYTGIQIGMGLLNIFGLWLLIEIYHMPTVYSSITVISVLFVLRFIAFKITKLTID